MRRKRANAAQNRWNGAGFAFKPDPWKTRHWTMAEIRAEMDAERENGLPLTAYLKPFGVFADWPDQYHVNPKPKAKSRGRAK